MLILLAIFRMKLQKVHIAKASQSFLQSWDILREGYTYTLLQQAVRVSVDPKRQGFAGLLTFNSRLDEIKFHDVFLERERERGGNVKSKVK